MKRGRGECGDVDGKLNDIRLSTLPAHAAKESILQALYGGPDDCSTAAPTIETGGSPIVLITGATGSGKSTQIPQFILDSGRPPSGSRARGVRIAVTQPRRIAAISLAKRVTAERELKARRTGAVPVDDVGYNVRYDCCLPATARAGGAGGFVVYMTDGMLLREALRDPLLSHYDVIIIDEAHERSLATDIVLGLTAQMLFTSSASTAAGAADATRWRESESVRPCMTLNNSIITFNGPRAHTLKVIIMSATLELSSLYNVFPLSTPIIGIPGTSYPVAVRYLQPTSSDGFDRQGRLGGGEYEGVADAEAEDDEPGKYLTAAVREVLLLHYYQPPGDILVFLPGEREIRRAMQLLKRALEKRQQMLRLFLRREQPTGDEQEQRRLRDKQMLLLDFDYDGTAATAAPKVSSSWQPGSRAPTSGPSAPHGSGYFRAYGTTACPVEQAGGMGGDISDDGESLGSQNGFGTNPGPPEDDPSHRASNNPNPNQTSTSRAEEVPRSGEDDTGTFYHTLFQLEAVILPLYSSLPLEEQSKVFIDYNHKDNNNNDGDDDNRYKYRKIILATNIAETSLTVDGVSFVVDSCLQKASLYHCERGLHYLLPSYVSKAAAAQRAGRTGRTWSRFKTYHYAPLAVVPPTAYARGAAPGGGSGRNSGRELPPALENRVHSCLRLLMEDQFERHCPDHNHPEIVKADITPIVLLLLGVGAARAQRQGTAGGDGSTHLLQFPFITPPSQASLLHSLWLLMGMGAVSLLPVPAGPAPATPKFALTPYGSILAQIPAHPTNANMILRGFLGDAICSAAGGPQRCVLDIIDIVAFYECGGWSLLGGTALRGEEAGAGDSDSDDDTRAGGPEGGSNNKNNNASKSKSNEVESYFYRYYSAPDVALRQRMRELLDDAQNLSPRGVNEETLLLSRYTYPSMISVTDANNNNNNNNDDNNNNSINNNNSNSNTSHRRVHYNNYSDHIALLLLFRAFLRFKAKVEETEVIIRCKKILQRPSPADGSPGSDTNKATNTFFIFKYLHLWCHRRGVALPVLLSIEKARKQLIDIVMKNYDDIMANLNQSDSFASSGGRSAGAGYYGKKLGSVVDTWYETFNNNNNNNNNNDDDGDADAHRGCKDQTNRNEARCNSNASTDNDDNSNAGGKANNQSLPSAQSNAFLLSFINNIENNIRLRDHDGRDSGQHHNQNAGSAEHLPSALPEPHSAESASTSFLLFNDSLVRRKLLLCLTESIAIRSDCLFGAANCSGGGGKHLRHHYSYSSKSDDHRRRLDAPSGAAKSRTCFSAIIEHPSNNYILVRSGCKIKLHPNCRIFASYKVAANRSKPYRYIHGGQARTCDADDNSYYFPECILIDRLDISEQSFTGNSNKGSNNRNNADCDSNENPEGIIFARVFTSLHPSWLLLGVANHSNDNNNNPETVFGGTLSPEMKQWIERHTK